MPLSDYSSRKLLLLTTSNPKTVVLLPRAGHDLRIVVAIPQPTCSKPTCTTFSKAQMKQGPNLGHPLRGKTPNRSRTRSRIEALC